MDRTEFATTQASVCFPGLHCSGSRLLCKDTVPGGLCMSCTSRSKPLRFSGAQQVTDPDGLCVLCPSWVRAAQSTGCLVSALSPVGCASYHLPGPGCLVSQVCDVSLLGSCSQAVTLLADVNHPGSQEDVVSNWEPAHSWMEDEDSGAESAAALCLPVPAVTCLPLRLWERRTL